MKLVKREYDGKEVSEMHFSGKLLSISSEVKEFNNEKKTRYRVATIEFVTLDGELARTPCLVYDKNFQKGMVIGETYLAVAIQSESGPFVTCSHLIYSGNKSTNDMFGFTDAKEGAKELHKIAEKADAVVG